MEAIKQALTTLRVETEKNVVRRKEADLQARILENKLQNRDEEIARLQERLESTRIFIRLADRWDAMRRKLREQEERIALAEGRAEELKEVLVRVEGESGSLEAQYLDIDAERKTLEQQLDDLY